MFDKCQAACEPSGSNAGCANCMTTKCKAAVGACVNL